jgi:hypothetical protein
MDHARYARPVASTASPEGPRLAAVPPGEPPGQERGARRQSVGGDNHLRGSPVIAKGLQAKGSAGLTKKSFQHEEPGKTSVAHNKRGGFATVSASV